MNFLSRKKDDVYELDPLRVVILGCLCGVGYYIYYKYTSTESNVFMTVNQKEHQDWKYVPNSLNGSELSVLNPSIQSNVNVLDQSVQSVKSVPSVQSVPSVKSNVSVSNLSESVSNRSSNVMLDSFI